ncbi:DUF881 domain-containing protein [Aquibacillus halophilus]|uniref:DUF881 domain-containing protein n=1 Tax=Aquibacillus halophilus TaxID=930132 RepID=A0A6A8DE99_9BACI|nr:DUF881 domain-containing protein [Aquibacillus halophilus]MRH42169.1 DUF881 domain-containing protein [Aquibacillus halophilus]
MKIRSKITISLVCAFAGLMIAIQLQSIQEPNERDTRDLWEIRSQLQLEQKQQQQLYQQISESESVLEQYMELSEQEQLDTLKETIEELEKESGLTEVTGSGVVITVTPLYTGMENIQEYPTVTPDLLNRLLNELNIYGATDISIGNERIINVTPIRFVNGKTYVNNHALPTVPMEVKVLSNNPNRLLDYIQVSQSRDDFAIENLELTPVVVDNITLPKYEGTIQMDEVEVNELEETGEN